MARWITYKGRHLLVDDDGSVINNRYDDSNFKYLPEDELGAYDKYVEMADESYDNVSQKDRDIINQRYVKTEDSYDFNEDLRNDIIKDKELVSALDRATKSYVAKEYMASTRFIDMNFLRKNYNMNIPEYGNVDRKIVAFEMKKNVGKELNLKGYTSVSLNESGNGMFGNLAIKMRINIPKGETMYIPDNLGEYEAILKRNTKVKLKKVDFQESKIQGFENEYGKILLTYEVEE